MMRKFSSVPSHAHERLSRRPGTILALLALTMVALLGFVALAIDIGMLTIAKTQAQNAVDLAALTAARTLNGNSTVSTYNNVAATSNAQAILSYNVILGQPIQTSQLALTYGSYDYNQNSQAFAANYPPLTNVPWTAVAATITSNNLPGAFSNVLGSQFLPNVSATAQAVHRPRDIALIMDLSASMRLGTSLGFDYYQMTRTTNNPDPLVPTFAQYSGGNAAAYLIGPSATRTSANSGYTISPTNTTVANSSYSLTYINSFYQNAAYASTWIRAFDSYSSTDGGNTWVAPTTQTPQLPPASYATMPGGDVPLFQSGSTTVYAQTVNQALGLSATNTAANMLWELDGYSAYAAGLPDTSGTGGVPQVWLQADYSAPASPPANGSLPFNGYTQGPGYYGKTFFLWPPDPRTTTVPSGSTLTGYLAALGITNATDQATLTNIWPTWQAKGAVGLGYLAAWLKGTATNGASKLPQIAGGNYTSTKVPGFTTWNGKTLATANQPSTYYAVCRLFNRAYPGGTAWTSTSFSADWRMRFFGTTNNTVIFNSSGSLNPPGTSGMCSATTTYNAILSWLTATSDPFPTQMRSGRIKYYGSIPTSITGTWPSYGSTDQRYWVEFVDHVLGFRQTAAGTYMDISGISSSNTLAGYGADIAWGTVSINATPTTTPQAYMNYPDNPARGLLRHWFSPMLMVDFLHQSNMYENSIYYPSTLGNFFIKQPANSYEAPLYTAKQAFVAAVTTMQNNHPNDWFTLAYYSWPRTSATAIWGRSNCVACPLGTNYNYATSALLFPFSTFNADGSSNGTEVTPFDADPATGLVPSANFVDCPRSDGDTCFAMGLMLAYNQFAVTPVTDPTLRGFVSNSPIDFPSGMAGGMGRKGSQKLVIFETDGIANCYASANLVTNGSYNYYQIRYDMNNPNSSEYPTSVTPSTVNDAGVMTQVNNLVSAMATQYGTSRNPFRLYAIGFGPVFTGADASLASSNLVSMQNAANGTSLSSLPSNQIITGTDAQMSANMVSVFTSILNNGVQIALIK